MSDKVKIKMFVNTGFAACSHEDSFEVDRSEWESMSEDEQGAYLDECASEYMSNCIEFGAYVDD